MSWWQLATLISYVEFRRLDGSDLIICVEFRKLDASDLEGLVLDTDLVISEIPSSSTSLPITTWAHLMGSKEPATSLSIV